MIPHRTEARPVIGNATNISDEWWHDHGPPDTSILPYYEERDSYDLVTAETRAQLDFEIFCGLGRTPSPPTYASFLRHPENSGRAFLSAPAPVVCTVSDPLNISLMSADMLESQGRRAGDRTGWRHALLTNRLSETEMGRGILRLRDANWYRAHNGFGVTTIPERETRFSVHDLAIFLRWLNPDLGVHQSTRRRLLCLEKIDALNEIYLKQGYSSIRFQEEPEEFFANLLRSHSRLHAMPTFLRPIYSQRSTAVSRFYVGIEGIDNSTAPRPS